jgi:hypothetical protein
MIIYGHRAREIDVATGEFDCPRCQARRGFKHKRVVRYFTLFFIPLFPLGRLGEYVECQTCFTTHKTEALNLPSADASAPQLAGQVSSIPATVRPIKPNYTGRGWVLAVVGAIAFLCAGLFGILMTIGQLAGEAGPANNLEGFIGALILCPTPVAVLGMLLLVGGLLMVWKNQPEVNAQA